MPALPGLASASAESGLPPPHQNATNGVHEPLPAQVEAALWRGDQLGSAVAEVRSTGFTELDAVLPGGGWPCGSLTEVLLPQFSIGEFRLLSPALADLTRSGRTIVLVGPMLAPHPAGLRHDGIDEKFLIWVDVDAPRERLWATEQLVKSGSAAAIVAWLPMVRAEQVRRLQVLAGQCQGPVFLCRPMTAAHDASAAPLRVAVRAETDWTIAVDVLKRRGVPLDATLRLLSMPGGLASIMTPRLRYPSRLVPQGPSHVVVSPAAAAVRERSSIPEASEH